VKQAAGALDEDASDSAAVQKLDHLRFQQEITELRISRLERSLDESRSMVVQYWNDEVLVAVMSLQAAMQRRLTDEVRRLVEEHFDQTSNFNVQIAASNYKPLKSIQAMVSGLGRVTSTHPVGQVCHVREGLTKVIGLLMSVTLKTK
jgi:hypothetical protein